MCKTCLCVVLALLGWLTLSGANSSAELEKRDRAQQTSPVARLVPTPTPTPTPTSTASPSSKFTAYPGYNPDPCYHAEDHDAADLCAQWRASMAAENSAHESRRATTWSIVATILSALSFMAVAAALRLTIQSNAIARTTAHAQLRPYVHAYDIHWQARGTSGNQYFDFKVRFKNFGQTPASDLQLTIFGLLSENDADLHEVQLYLLPDSQKQPLGPTNEIMTSAYTVDDETLNAVWRGEKRLFIAGIVVYRDAFSDKPRETRCHYEIRMGKQDGQFNYAWWDIIGSHNSST
jgi:hypothetical protein